MLDRRECGSLHVVASRAMGVAIKSHCSWCGFRWLTAAEVHAALGRSKVIVAGESNDAFRLHEGLRALLADWSTAMQRLPSIERRRQQLPGTHGCLPYSRSCALYAMAAYAPGMPVATVCSICRNPGLLDPSAVICNRYFTSYQDPASSNNKPSST
jgi:hypothetical protein